MPAASLYAGTTRLTSGLHGGGPAASGARLCATDIGDLVVLVAGQCGERDELHAVAAQQVSERPTRQQCKLTLPVVVRREPRVAPGEGVHASRVAHQLVRPPGGETRKPPPAVA